MTVGSHEKTVIIGKEYDDRLRGALRRVLIHLRATGLSHDWGIGGSQELETTEVLVGPDRIVIEAETFVGLSIRGPDDVVDRIRALVEAAMNPP